MSEFSSGLNGCEHAELLRRKGLINQKERARKKRILRKDILTGCLALSIIYALKLDREFTMEEWAGILEELLKKNRREQREADKKKIEEILRIGESSP